MDLIRIVSCETRQHRVGRVDGSAFGSGHGRTSEVSLVGLKIEFNLPPHVPSQHLPNIGLVAD